MRTFAKALECQTTQIEGRVVASGGLGLGMEFGEMRVPESGYV